MMMVTKAIIVPVKWHELKVGDFILVSNRKCKVTRVPFHFEDGQQPVEFTSVDGILTTFEKRFSYYYKIIDCEELNLCYICEKEIILSGRSVEYCEKCEKECMGGCDNEMGEYGSY